MGGERESEREGERERGGREIERQRGRETERQRDRETKGQGETEIARELITPVCMYVLCVCVSIFDLHFHIRNDQQMTTMNETPLLVLTGLQEFGARITRRIIKENG